MENLIEYYFKEQKYYEKIYGSKTLFMMQVGGFYEMYETLTEGPDLNKISSILNILVSKRNKSILSVDKKNPKMSGFPLAVLNKYLKILIDNSYTVIICSQTTSPPNPKREITGIYSSSTYIDDISNPENNFLLSNFCIEFDPLTICFLIVLLTDADFKEVPLISIILVSTLVEFERIPESSLF